MWFDASSESCPPQIKGNIVPVFQASALESFTAAIFRAVGTDDAAAKLVASSLIEANLRGHDSHGVMRIPDYITRIRDGRIKPDSRLRIELETPGSILGDGQWGIGQVVSHELLDRLIEKSESVAISIGTLQHSGHIGRLGEYAEKAAAAGMVSIVCANTHGAAQRVAPVGGKRPRLGTNPLCIGFPGGYDGPFVLDIGTSATAEGKVRVKKIAGQPVPLGWILDPDGRPTTDPNQLYGNPPGTILPLGGDQAYKGFGLAFMIELMCGALSGGNCAYPNPPAPLGNCAVFLVINPRFLGGAEHLQREATGLEAYVRSTPLIEGASTVQLPGDPERSTRARRLANGVDLDEGNWKAIVELAGPLGVAPPSTAGG